jgi:hypothetical protein
LAVWITLISRIENRSLGTAVPAVIVADTLQDMVVIPVVAIWAVAAVVEATWIPPVAKSMLEMFFSYS